MRDRKIEFSLNFLETSDGKSHFQFNLVFIGFYSCLYQLFMASPIIFPFHLFSFFLFELEFLRYGAVLKRRRAAFVLLHTHRFHGTTKLQRDTNQIPPPPVHGLFLFMGSLGCKDFTVFWSRRNFTTTPIYLSFVSFLHVRPSYLHAIAFDNKSTLDLSPPLTIESHLL